jgi:hypothetical protein
MAVETKYNTSHHAGGTPEARINNRLRNSGAGAFPDTTVQNGCSAQRVFHNVHLAGHRPNPGTAAKPTEGRVTKLESSKVGGVGHND